MKQCNKIVHVLWDRRLALVLLQHTVGVVRFLHTVVIHRNGITRLHRQKYSYYRSYHLWNGDVQLLCELDGVIEVTDL